jgi:CRP-like cAMP-binding protein
MPLRRNVKLELLSRVELFRACSKRQLAQIGSLADELDLEAGRTLISEGVPGREFFVLVEGTVKITRRGRRIAELGPGGWFGEIALIMNAPRSATVVTTSPVRVLVIEQRAFRQLLRDVPSIQLKVLESLAARLAAESL